MIETPLRPRIDLRDGWGFTRQRVGRSWLAGRGGTAESVMLPHCWNDADTFQYGRRSYSGWGAYRREIGVRTTNATQETTWRFRTGGFYGLGDVWLDGRRLAKIDGQYLGVSIHLPLQPESREHIIALRINNVWRRNVLPGFRQPDFILHGGLAGGAWLESTPPVHFDVERVEVVCERQPSGDELVTVKWAVTGPSADGQPCDVDWSISDPDGNLVGVSATRSDECGSEDSGRTHSASMMVPAPRCWSPEDPALYWAEGRLSRGGTAVDIVRVRFGVTRAEFRPRRGLHINGERVDLHGCNRHEAIPGFGSALPDNLHQRDAQIMKELGCNFVRLSHYPQSPVFLDACDELGIMVYAEIASWKSVRSARGWRRAARRQLRDLVVRDRHHPCIALWGMGNESRSRKAYLELRSIARELDPSRPVTYAENHLYRAKREHTVGVPDVWGVNYEIEVLDEACASSSFENVVVSECGNHPQSVRGDDLQELIQVAAIERDWELMADHAFVAGHAIWCLADYATEHHNRFRRLPGLLDAWRRPKMAAELFRARYSTRPFVALFVTRPGPAAEATRYRIEHRAEGVGRANFELHAFTNCDTLRLARDGSMIAVLEGAIHHVLPLYGGFDEIIATGSLNGEVVQDSVKRHGEPERIHLRPSVASTAPTQELDVEILDSRSSVVGGWNGAVRITVEGPGRSHLYNEAHEVPVARGIGRAYVTVSGNHDAVVVTASAPGLSPGILSLHGS